MTVKRMDNVGIVVEDIDAAIEFFAELGLELEGRAPIEGDWADGVTGLRDMRVEIAMMRTPDGHGRLEISRFLAPRVVADHRIVPVNSLGYLRVMFTVEDIDDTLARLFERGAELVGEVVQYENAYRLCFIRGPEGILIGLAQELERESRIYLRAVTEGDLPVLFEQQREPEANEMAVFPARDHDAFMAHWAKILEDESMVAMTGIVDGCVAGYVGCWTQDGRRLVGYWIGKEYWGRGVATQMLSIFLRLVVDRPLYAYVAESNIASIRVLEKCGLVRFESAAGAVGKPADGIEEWVYVTAGSSEGRH